ncbi:hypothetical protein [Calidithermus terrae]|uniref:hypothetical protein n=1 Tax=Calidithermus terrae TaxID=1408545 RepID=UPI0011C3A46A|nr:hypothetical protein [Calidithermus terrae]
MDREKLMPMLAAVFDAVNESADVETLASRREEFVFHMTDWLEDLKRLTDLYTSPDKPQAEANKVVVGFLYHVVPHLKAASRLLLGEIPDAFEE